ncbi:MAG: hypothetical protein ACTH8C_15250, partial [Pseudomonas taetrolens]|uniref:hypothetical protein n=1 Tax=Pseudomonas taetrolens TaxID=47884 RepID=UPI003F9D6183
LFNDVCDRKKTPRRLFSFRRDPFQAKNTQVFRQQAKRSWHPEVHVEIRHNKGAFRLLLQKERRVRWRIISSSSQ